MTKVRLEINANGSQASVSEITMTNEALDALVANCGQVEGWTQLPSKYGTRDILFVGQNVSMVYVELV